MNECADVITFWGDSLVMAIIMWSIAIWVVFGSGVILLVLIQGLLLRWQDFRFAWKGWRGRE